MAKQEWNESEATTAKQAKRKISVRTVKLSKQEPGFSFSGIYRGQVLGAPFQRVDAATGEVLTRQLTSIVMEDEKGVRTAFVADKGLVGALNEAMVKEGARIEVVKLEKTNLSGGRTMNQYDIFAL